jgi:hypothetical protein
MVVSSSRASGTSTFIVAAYGQKVCVHNEVTKAYIEEEEKTESTQPVPFPLDLSLLTMMRAALREEKDGIQQQMSGNAVAAEQGGC